MQTDTLVQFLAATALVTVIPGPNILLIVNDSVRYGTRNGLLTVFGVSAGMIPLFLLSLAGVSTLMVQSPLAFDAVKLIGCVYLVYLGTVMVISSFRKPQNTESPFSSSNRFFIHGMLICITNPKGILFAGAFFPQFIEKSSPILPQVTALIAGCLFVATIIGGLYAAFAGTAASLLQSEKFTRYTPVVSGALLALMGLGFLFFRP